jgi:DNA (cytosine-5)-methyltransferase 1
MKQILVNSYFSGCGMMDIGLERAGLTLQQSFEIDPDAVNIARFNFDHEVVQCDLTNKLALDEKPCHVRSFTYPCTKYSPIADIHGTRTGDDLYLHALRHMALKPSEVYVAENVPGMRKFPIVMEVMTKLPDYYVKVFCPVSSQTWLPQRRDRLIIIGSRKPFEWRPPKSTRRITLKEIVEENPEVEVPECVYARMRGEYRDLPIISDPEANDLAPTCVAHYAKDLSTRLLKDKRYPMEVRPYSVREYARLQGVPDTFLFPCSKTKAYKMIGNGVSIPVAEWIGSEVKRYFEK